MKTMGLLAAVSFSFLNSVQGDRRVTHVYVVDGSTLAGVLQSAGRGADSSQLLLNNVDFGARAIMGLNSPPDTILTSIFSPHVLELLGRSIPSDRDYETMKRIGPSKT